MLVFRVVQLGLDLFHGAIFAKTLSATSFNPEGQETNLAGISRRVTQENRPPRAVPAPTVQAGVEQLSYRCTTLGIDVPVGEIFGHQYAGFRPNGKIITLGVRAMGTIAREEDTIPIQGFLVAPSFVRKGSHEAKR